MDSEELNVVIVSALACYVANEYLKTKKNKKRVRRCFSRIENLDRNIFGFYNSCFVKLKENEEEFFKFTRMTVPVYDLLLSLLHEQLLKKKTRYTINAESRLVITLSYLSQGVSHQYLGWSYKIGRTTARKIILETCTIIWEVLAPLYVYMPKEEDYKIIANDFENIWNLPNCVGAMDGKHISVRCPPRSGSQFYNYKNFFSVVLLATCDARYTFTMVDVGAYGSQSDGGILSNCPFGQELFSGKLPIPAAKNLPKTNTPFPHYFIGDPAFPLRENLMRPYPGKCLSLDKKIFNYRISRARVVIENSFGILVARWRILLTTINCFPKNAEKVVLAAVGLHNFIKLNQLPAHKYCPPSFIDHEDNDGNFVPGGWRNEVEPAQINQKKPNSYQIIHPKMLFSTAQF